MAVMRKPRLRAGGYALSIVRCNCSVETAVVTVGVPCAEAQTRPSAVSLFNLPQYRLRCASRLLQTFHLGPLCVGDTDSIATVALGPVQRRIRPFH